MVTTIRSKSKKLDVSSTTNQVKDLAQRRQEIPQALYDAIMDADNIRKFLCKSLRTDYDLNKILDDTEETINFLAFYYTEELPRGWKYDHNTTIDAYVAKPPTPPRMKKIKRTITRLPTINGTAFTGEEQKVWKDFVRMNRKVEPQPYISAPMDDNLIRVEETDPVVKVIVDFAVDAFNDFYHKYVKEHASKNITKAVPLVCEYYKLSLKYCFYMTLDAIEQGKPGLYKVAVECDCASGARKLCQFALTNVKPRLKLSYYETSVPDQKDVRSFGQESEYEKAWSSDESEPEDFYAISGMVKRMATMGGGFNYQNPSSVLHKCIANYGRNRMYRGVED